MTSIDQQQYFQESFILNIESRGFLEERGFYDEDYSDFGVGYCPVDCPHELSPFRSRITIPIYDLQGDLVAFGGRLIGRSDGPKWYNSPESATYKKGKLLYNLHAAQDYILKDGSAILVEGYFDVMRLWSSGFRNVVASCGTALTHWQIRILKRFASEVIIAYDGDKAGVVAAERAKELCAEERYKCRVVRLPDELDPDSYILNYGPYEMRKLIYA